MPLLIKLLLQNGIGGTWNLLIAVEIWHDWLLLLLWGAHVRESVLIDLWRKYHLLQILVLEYLLLLHMTQLDLLPLKKILVVLELVYIHVVLWPSHRRLRLHCLNHLNLRNLITLHFIRHIEITVVR